MELNEIMEILENYLINQTNQALEKNQDIKFKELVNLKAHLLCFNHNNRNSSVEKYFEELYKLIDNYYSYYNECYCYKSDVYSIIWLSFKKQIEIIENQYLFTKERFNIQETGHGTYIILDNEFPILVLNTKENAMFVKEILKKDNKKGIK